VARSETASPGETEEVGATLARRLAPGDVVLVAGELGSGKTTLVRGACRALGVAEPVTSPSFTIGQLYRGGAGEGANGETLEVAHVDLFRLSSLAGEDPGLLADYLTPERVGFVEWPALAEPELTGLRPGVRIAARVRLEHAGGDARAVEVVGEPAA
jgi:tRNA threonylcarbamoyladenosine biosynthesis protein TsaE